MQGLTGREGTFHAKACAEYGTKVVGGVTPGKGGTTHEGWPVFNTVADAVEKTGANATVIFVPPPFAADAIMEAADAGIAADRLHHRGHSDARHGEGVGVPEDEELAADRAELPGRHLAGQGKIGIMPAHIHKEGNVGIVSRSGTLTYEAVYQLTTRGIGQSTAIGIGGDPIIGTNFIDALRLFNDDPGDRSDHHDRRDRRQRRGDRGRVSSRQNVKKPVVGFIAGQTAPPGRRMGHAGAIISGGKGTAAEKMKAMEAAGIHVAKSPAEIGETLVKAQSAVMK